MSKVDLKSDDILTAIFEIKREAKLTLIPAIEGKYSGRANPESSPDSSENPSGKKKKGKTDKAERPATNDTPANDDLIKPADATEKKTNDHNKAVARAAELKALGAVVYDIGLNCFHCGAPAVDGKFPHSYSQCAKTQPCRNCESHHL